MDDDQWLKRIREATRRHGGELLSGAYRGSRERLRFRCAARHEFDLLPTTLIHASAWCGRCKADARASKVKAAAFARYRKMARANGGACLTRDYIDSSSPMRWRCAEGHEWETSANAVQQGSWCPRCGGTVPLTLEDMRELARARGGECLAKRYVEIRTPLRWRCAEGHEWMAPPERIKHHHTWCGVCARRSKLTVEELGALAAAHDGICLSREVTSMRGTYSWRCKMNHEFVASAHDVQQGHWCTRCHGRLPDTLGRYRELARRRGGKLLSRTYVNAFTKVDVRCAMGHEWSVAPASLVRGHWCQQCARAPGKNTQPLSLEEMQQIASERGGRVVSTAYVNMKTPLEWECALGHRWVAAPANVKHSRSWCPVCAYSFPGTLDGMRRLADERGGALLSDEYVGHKTMLRWRCGAGHRFEARGMAVKSGVWCSQCARARCPRATRSRASRHRTLSSQARTSAIGL